MDSISEGEDNCFCNLSFIYLMASSRAFNDLFLGCMGWRGGGAGSVTMGAGAVVVPLELFSFPEPFFESFERGLYF